MIYGPYASVEEIDFAIAIHIVSLSERSMLKVSPAYLNTLYDELLEVRPCQSYVITSNITKSMVIDLDYAGVINLRRVIGAYLKSGF